MSTPREMTFDEARELVLRATGGVFSASDCAMSEVELSRAKVRIWELEHSRIDRDVLQEAIYAISLRHDWANTLDMTDRTDEIADEYDEAILGQETGRTA